MPDSDPSFLMHNPSFSASKYSPRPEDIAAYVTRYPGTSYDVALERYFQKVRLSSQYALGNTENTMRLARMLKVSQGRETFHTGTRFILLKPLIFLCCSICPNRSRLRRCTSSASVPPMGRTRRSQQLCSGSRRDTRRTASSGHPSRYRPTTSPFRPQR